MSQDKSQLLANAVVWKLFEESSGRSKPRKPAKKTTTKKKSKGKKKKSK